MNVLDIPSQVPDSLVRCFMEVPERMVHIPQSGNLVAGIGIHQLAQPSGIGENSHAFDQEADFLLPGSRQKLVEVLPHLVFPVPERAEGHIGNFHGGGCSEKGVQLFRVFQGKGQIDRGVKAGENQLVFTKIAQGLVLAVDMESAPAPGQ